MMVAKNIMLNFAIFLQTTGLSDFLGKSNVIFSSSPQASASTATSHKAPSPTPGNVTLLIKGLLILKVRLHVPSPSPSNFNIVPMEMGHFFTKWVQNPFCRKTVRFHWHNVNNLMVTVTDTVCVNGPLASFIKRPVLFRIVSMVTDWKRSEWGVTHSVRFSWTMLTVETKIGLLNRATLNGLKDVKCEQTLRERSH